MKHCPLIKSSWVYAGVFKQPSGKRGFVPQFSGGGGGGNEPGAIGGRVILAENLPFGIPPEPLFPPPILSFVFFFPPPSFRLGFAFSDSSLVGAGGGGITGVSSVDSGGAGGSGNASDGGKASYAF